MQKHCSFCGKTENDNVIIIEGAEASICSECIATCNEEVVDMAVETQSTQKKFMKPHEIKAELDKYVIGQEEAKKILSVAVYNHYKRIFVKTKVEIQKTNILLIGPTGSGKTYVMQTLAKILDVPLVIADATSLTEAGYVGEDVETILEKLIKNANGDISRAERGIVYIDEIDKITKKENSSSSGKDPSGEGVQQALLKMVEDSEINVPMGGNGMFQKKVTLNTKNILFVCGGAFVGLEDIVKKRTSPKKKKIGFEVSDTLTDEQQEMDIVQKDVIDFGMIPELVGRIPVIASLKSLNKIDLTNILIKPKNAILKQYKELFKIDGISLKFDNDAVEYIVDEAIRKNIGARGLKGVIEKRMYDIMYDLPQQADIKEYTVTKELLSYTHK